MYIYIYTYEWMYNYIYIHNSVVKLFPESYVFTHIDVMSHCMAYQLGKLCWPHIDHTVDDGNQGKT